MTTLLSATASGTTQPTVFYNTYTTTTHNLTTTFTPPAQCFAPTYTLSPSGNDSATGNTVNRGYNPDCFPTGFFDAVTVTITRPTKPKVEV
ncbi:uncharacterized protein RHO25_003796 [Cercospora beticola]|uniref:Uncharacterized protein n=1 Tax=Cercospora beticola TaxID=122368 RepID=A0ABZ0NI33_CERBT|nr:hypothetical protein RHO25_003796 [Cercospora beticola]